MPQRKTALAFGVLFAVALACSQGWGAVTFLRTQGQDMVDESGKKVLLRGVGLGNWMLPEGYMWRFGDQGDRPRKIEKIVSDLIGPENAARFWSEFRKNYITEADIARIAELGFNSVRPALNARLFLTEGDNAVYVEEGFQLLDNLVGWCRKHDLYVIIDMHGAPGGQTGANIDDSPNDQPELFTDKKNQDRLVDLWVKIAGRYKNEPTVAGYDLLNEPLPQRTGAAAKYKDQLEPLYKRITAAIREVDKRHMITLEGCDWANDWSVFSTPFDKQPVLPVSFLLLGPADQAQRHQPVPRAPQRAQCPGLGRRDGREGQRHLLGDDAVLRDQQHRLVVLALEEDGDDEHAVLDQDAARMGRDPGLFPQRDQTLRRSGPESLRRTA